MQFQIRGQLSQPVRGSRSGRDRSRRRGRFHVRGIIESRPNPEKIYFPLTQPYYRAMVDANSMSGASWATLFRLSLRDMLILMALASLAIVSFKYASTS